MAILYTADVVSAGDGRSGTVTSSDGLVDLRLTPPKELGGSGEGTNPEQLFAAGYAACFHSALRAAARERRLTLYGDTVNARVSLAKDDNGYRIQADLHISLPSVEPHTARELAQAAHQRCPYSRAVDGNVPVGIFIET